MSFCTVLQIVNVTLFQVCLDSQSARPSSAELTFAPQNRVPCDDEVRWDEMGAEIIGEYENVSWMGEDQREQSHVTLAHSLQSGSQKSILSGKGSKQAVSSSERSIATVHGSRKNVPDSSQKSFPEVLPKSSAKSIGGVSSMAGTDASETEAEENEEEYELE